MRIPSLVVSVSGVKDDLFRGIDVCSVAVSIGTRPRLGGIMVLDDLDEGSRLRTLDQGQKRLLSATGTRLLRLWRLALRDGGSRRVVEEARRIEGLVSGTGERRRKGVED